MLMLEEIKDNYLNETFSKASGCLEEIKEDISYIKNPVGLGDYARYFNALNELLLELKKIKLSFDLAEVKKRLEDSYEKNILDQKLKEVELNDYYDKSIQARVQELEEAAKTHNKGIVENFNQDNKIYLKLEEKRLQLEHYTEEILTLCSAYGITTGDVTLNNSSFEIEELEKIYDDCLDFIKKKGIKTNPIRWFREKFDNIVFQATVLLLVMLLTFTVFLDLSAAGFLIIIVYRQIKAKDNVKTYLVLMALLYHIKPLEMGFKSEIDKTVFVEEEIDEETDTKIQELADDWEKRLSVLDKDNPEAQLQAECLVLIQNSDDILEEMESLRSGFEHDKEELVEEINDRIKQARKEYEEKKARVKLLGDEITESKVYKTVFRLGLKSEVIEESRDLGLSNIIIHPSEDENLQKTFLQVMLANAICNVQAGMLSIVVYDPNKFGRDLVGFYKQELEKLMEFKNEGLEKIVESLKTYASDNMKEMRGITINEFNENAIKIGRTTKEYKLLIVLSQPKKIEEDEALSEFMSYSAELGVFVWLMSNKSLPNTVVFQKPFEKVEHPYLIDTNEFPIKVCKTLVDAIEKSKVDSLPWKDFIQIAVPEKDTWTYVTDQFLDLDPGFHEGDPSKFKGYTVGNEGNIHVIGVGATGSGKSVFLNELIATATRKYSPRTLELWLVDYKGTEFKFYLANEEHPYMLPHIKACLCTSDGDYAGSLYAALRKVAEDRYNNLKLWGYKNIKEYNQMLRSTGRENEVIPRILFVNDEFQVIFEKAEQKVIEQINKDITYISKVARAAGIHLFFTSQSMKKTVSADILQQFTLRFALRCDDEVSMAIMGTKLASGIKQKFGFLYARSLDDASLESQKRYRTPFLADAVLREHIKEMAIRAKKEGIPQHNPIITYEETTIHQIEELESFYKESIWSTIEAGHKENAYGIFVLGMRMTYSNNAAPENIKLQAKNNTHIIAAFGEDKDFINFYKTIRQNILLFKAETQVFYNSQVADMHYLCELDQDVPKEQLDMSDEKTSIYDLLDFFENIYEMRVQSNLKDVPIYFVLLGWDKAVGFGIDKDTMHASRFGTLLQICGEYNMHFIFILSAKGQIGANIVKACSKRICGRVDEDTSYFLIDSKQGSKPSEMENGYMYIWQRGLTSRAKIYQSVLERKVAEEEFVL